MSQMRKSLFVSAISRGHCLFPRCLLNPTAIQKIALSKEGLRFSLDGCYVGMDSDALCGSVVLEVPYLCPATAPHSQDPRCKGSPPPAHTIATLFQGQHWGKGRIHQSAASRCKILHPGDPSEDVRCGGWMREGDILWSQEKCGRTEGLPFKTNASPPRLLRPEDWPFSCQKQVL